MAQEGGCAAKKPRGAAKKQGGTAEAQQSGAAKTPRGTAEGQGGRAAAQGGVAEELSGATEEYGIAAEEQGGPEAEELWSGSAEFYEWPGYWLGDEGDNVVVTVGGTSGAQVRERLEREGERDRYSGMSEITVWRVR